MSCTSAHAFDVRKQCLEIISDITNKQEDSSVDDINLARKWLLYYREVPTRLQGKLPRCGLSAVSMAAELINLKRILGDDNVVSSAQKPYEEELNNLLTLAKSRGFSDQGEMYSAENLAHLAEEFYGVKCSVISNAFEDQHSTVSQLLKGSAVLVPYDADKNNKPCLENGHRAHWALLTGVLCELCDNSIDWTLFEQDVDVPMLFCVSPLQSFVLPANCKLGHVYFCIKHGKSKHTVVWTLESLKSSNANLLELDPKRRLAGNCIVPRDGLRVGLCQKIVLMSGKS